MYEYSRECLALVVARRLRATDVLEILADRFVVHGAPSYLRSANGPEFTARIVRTWLRAVGNIMRGCRDPTIPCHRVVGAGGALGGYGGNPFVET